ncbi:hypothetical protein ABID56_001298 [Alkalibacillus flavidus]|uniref:Uncharacterized protein n=1 Tax=Alkalibacillus flavidus TaxID=546021 RepID=A0ABV2KVU4_9BACI
MNQAAERLIQVVLKVNQSMKRLNQEHTVLIQLDM